MSVWFNGSNELRCSIDVVIRAMQDVSQHYVDLLRLMPGLTSVELVGGSADHVTIQTNEGLLKRQNISVLIEEGRVVVEFDEEYRAGLIGVVRSHYRDEFKTSATGVMHRTSISDVSAPGVLGFLYKTFGRFTTGKAVLASNKAYFETP